VTPVTAKLRPCAYLHAQQADQTESGVGEKGVAAMTRTRSTKGWNATLAAVFAVTVAAALTGATDSGETKETSIDAACAHVTWPMIPAYCLEGGSDRPVRIVSVDNAALGQLTSRFAAAFE